MAERPSDLGASWWGKNLDEVDSEVARLASICGVRILDPGVIERVLHGDATVCGNANALAFDKLRNVMMMHYKIREKAVGAIGEAETEVLIKAIVERLQKRLAGNLGGPPSA